ncbi:MAG: hypothetical protein JO270_20050 [Acidobacteriaceae bacterium]|nr:hypothetical protein [Acidobacteriaceae bacterium]
MIYGWDVSTAIVGFTAFTNAGEWVASHHCDLRKADDVFEDKASVLNYKADRVMEFVEEMFDKYHDGTGDCHFVEDRLAGFSGGGSNAGTIMRLAAFNAMVCWMIWCKWRGVGHIGSIHPTTVKATMKSEGLLIPKGGDKKKLTLDWVKARESEFPVDKNRNDNPQPYCYDRADSYITGRAGYLLRKRFCKHAPRS